MSAGLSLWQVLIALQHKQVFLVASRDTQLLIQICCVQLALRRLWCCDGNQAQDLELLELNANSRLCLWGKLGFHLRLQQPYSIVQQVN